MSVPSRLLLNLTSPGWSPARWLRQTPEAKWHSGWAEIVLLADDLQAKGALKGWSKRDTETLMNQLEIWRTGTGARRPLNLIQAARLCRWLVQTSAFRLSDTLEKKLSGKKKAAWVRKCLLDKELLERSRDAYWFDECLDRILGLHERQIKQTLREKGALDRRYIVEEIYFETDPEDLYTPYRVLMQIFSQFPPKVKGTFVDLGSGLGRVGIVAGILRPQLNFLGYEIVHERTLPGIRAARALGLKRITFYHRDVSRFGLPPAELYFLFNPFRLSTLQHVTRQLRRMAPERKFLVITPTIGLPWSHLMRAPWLKTKWKIRPDPKWDGIGVYCFESKVTTNQRTARR